MSEEGVSFFFLKERIWLKRDLVRDMYHPQDTRSRTLACLSFLSHILTVSAERVLRRKSPVKVLWLSEAPLLWLFLQVQWLDMIWLSLTRVVHISWVTLYGSHGCSPHHVSINNFYGGREVKPCCYPTSGEWWMLPLWHFLLKNQGVMWASWVSKPLLDQMSSSRELKRCTC